MKFILTIEAATREELLAQLSGSSAAAAIVAAQPQAVAGDETDEAGDTPVAPGTLDKTGLQWDDRIHSTPATLTTKQVWRAKRGVTDKALIAQVEAELRGNGAVNAGIPAQQALAGTPVNTMPMAAHNGPIAQMPASPISMPQQPVAIPMPANPDNFVPVQQQPMVQPVQQYVAPVQQVPQPQPQQQQGVDFPTLMRNIGVGFQTPSQNGGMVVDAPYLASLCASVGVGNISEIEKDFAKINMVYGKMISEGRWLNA